MNIHLLYQGPEYAPKSLDKVVVRVDVNKLSQVVRNLVSNALKFTPKNGTVKVIASYLPRSLPGSKLSGRVRVEVKDSGCGISEV